MELPHDRFRALVAPTLPAPIADEAARLVAAVKAEAARVSTSAFLRGGSARSIAFDHLAHLARAEDVERVVFHAERLLPACGPVPAGSRRLLQSAARCAVSLLHPTALAA